MAKLQIIRSIFCGYEYVNSLNYFLTTRACLNYKIILEIVYLPYRLDVLKICSFQLYFKTKNTSLNIDKIEVPGIIELRDIGER